MQNADDVVVIAETEDDLVKGLNEWKDNVENRCMRATHTHTQLFYGSMDFARDNPGELLPEETFIHLHLS